MQKVSDEKSAQNEEEIDCIGSVAKQTDVLQIKKPVFPAYGGTMVQQNQQCCKKSQGIYPPEIGYIFVHQGVRETIYQKRNSKKEKWFAPIEEQTT
ncbi:MAG: hypothetical protein SO444_08265 [Candidatus Onthomorpha sp.]|nr:hypothetical protein [Candidatus Onthomorpha sp.]